MKKIKAIEVQRAIRKIAKPNKAAFFQRFFKTGKGQYGYGDIFLGLSVPEVRSVAREYRDLSIESCFQVLKSKFHEERMLALMILLAKYRKSESEIKNKIYTLYLKNRKHVNNWDLVDLSAGWIVGPHIPTAMLNQLVKSKNLWDRRIAVLSTFHHIRKNEFTRTLALAEKLLKDEEDLMHKAVGWMLREVGKRDEKVLKGFLKSYCTKMSRTMLRYSIEKFPPTQRKKYLLGEV